ALALVYQHRPAPVLRSTVALCFVVGEVLSLGLLAANGQVHASQFRAAFVLIPALAFGALTSRWVHHRVDGPVMRGVVLTFALASGAVLLLRG
ncbi:MAG: sulfite exporter TauE/SafE family protein, partial [Actinobacteria bacterium]|nr:sulfite exporter TauE/SafE family protein [Actinomycetota bacterium]